MPQKSQDLLWLQLFSSLNNCFQVSQELGLHTTVANTLNRSDISICFAHFEVELDKLELDWKLIHFNDVVWLAGDTQALEQTILVNLTFSVLLISHDREKLLSICVNDI